MAIIISTQKEVEFSNGFKFGLDVVGGKLQLAELVPSVYTDEGVYESDIIDLTMFLKDLKSISYVANTPLNTEIQIFTSTSTDYITFSDWIEISANGDIQSPKGRYLKVKVEMVGSKNEVERNLNIFSDTESSQFTNTKYVEFSGSLKLKKDYLGIAQRNTSWSYSGELYTFDLDKENLKYINELTVT